MRPKDQGTAWVRQIEETARTHGHKVTRLAEHGQLDPGDILIETGDGDHYIIEAKHTQQLNIHKTLDKTETKAERWADREGLLLTGVAVAWKRNLPLQDGQTNRRPAGQPIVAVPLNEWMELIGR